MTGDFRAPDYTGGGLVNLVAELERRLTGVALHPGLNSELGDRVPDADSYVFVLFDGLGDHQLDHPQAEPFRRDRVGAIDSPFPATTTVSMATIATGTTPAEHGILGYQLWMPELGEVVNTIKWTTLWGSPLDVDTTDVLPAPNLWERLRAASREPISLQPWGFHDSPMSRMLYRGARFEPWGSEREAVDAALDLAATAGRLVFLYVPHVDFAAHVTGQQDPEYAEAMAIAADMWDRLARSLPKGSALVGTADHGHVDIPLERQIRIDKADEVDRSFYGDVRAVFVRGDGDSIAARYPVSWIPRADMEHWWGPGDPHPAFDDRAPDGILVADDGHALLHRHADERLIGQHGAPTDAELRIPVLVASSK